MKNFSNPEERFDFESHQRVDKNLSWFFIDYNSELNMIAGALNIEVNATVIM